MTGNGTLMVRRCRTCQGKGVVEDAHCQLCQQRIAGDDPWWESEIEALPCSHGQENLVETTTCPECAGAGRSEQWLTPDELKAIQRGKVARIAFVAGLSLLLLVILAIVIFTTSRSQLLCGSWGYAAPLFLFLPTYLRSA